jgi:hypothetical protein
MRDQGKATVSFRKPGLIAESPVASLAPEGKHSGKESVF